MAASWTSTLSWVPDSLPSARPPTRWMFYIVSKIARQHRPLAVVGRHGCRLDYDGFGDLNIVASVRRVLTILSDPANRLAIESERALAVDFFRGHPPGETKDPAYWVSKWGEPDPMKSGSDEFPFISTCLLLGVHESTLRDSMLHIQSLSLSRIYRGSDTDSGMVLVDITNLETPRYGIVAYAAMRAVERDLTQWGGDWSDFTPPQEQQLRQPLSAINYLKRFVSDAPEGEALELEAIPLVDAAAMELIWPPMYPTSLPSHSPPRSLRDQALMALISSTRQIEEFDISIFERPRQIPGFRKMLYDAIHDHLGLLSGSRSAGQLIGLAFSGSQHLDLVRLEEPSAELIRAAFEMEELKSITSISLCLDRVASISEILDVLAFTPSLRDMYFFQAPTRGNDKESTDLFTELSKRPHLFRRGRVWISGAYSAALEEKFWLPTAKDVHPPFDIFPIQHVFFRDQMLRGLPSRRFNRITPYYVGDSLFRAEAFVSGLLHWMLETDAGLRILATSPPSLDDMSRAEIKPPSPLVYNGGKVKSTSGFEGEQLWPEMRDILPGSWSVLLSWEDIKLETGFLGVKVRKYAFVRHRMPISVDTEGSTEEVTLGLEDVDVVGMQEFLKITAPHVDLAIIEQRLEELRVELDARHHIHLAGLPLGVPWLSVLEYKEACALLEEFILKGREARMN